MYYEGYFRSLDTSIDKLGQLYKVVLFTHTDTDGYYTSSKRTLQLASHPFNVKYTASEDTIFKHIKCSTASIDILLDDFDSNLVTTKRNESMAFLLKWNNDVIKDAEGYYNTVTKKKITIDSDDSVKDMFCYTIEWCGYITPNAYSQGFTKPHDEFTIECQDALSTLKYYDVDKTSDTDTFLSVLTIALSRFERVYKSIYVTSSIKMPSFVDNTDPRKNRILEHLMLIWENFYDEDESPDSYFDMIEEMMKYLNLTIIPFKDSLVILNYDAVGNTLMTYNRYDAQDKGFIYGFNKDIKMNLKYTHVGECVMGTQNNINADSICSTGTNISFTETYKKVNVTTDEYYTESLVPDFDDEEVFKTDLDFENVITGAVPQSGHDVEVKHVGSSFYLDTLWDDTHYIYAGSVLKRKPATIDKLLTNISTWETPAYGLDQFAVGHAYMPTTPISDTSEFTSFAQYQQHVCCIPLEYSVEEFKESTVLSSVLRSYSPSRAWYFNTPILTNYSSDSGLHNYDPYVYMKPTYTSLTTRAKQILLKINTKKTYMRSSQYLNIKGDWEFFMSINKNNRMSSSWEDGTHTAYLARPVPTQNNMTTSTYNKLKGDLGHMFVYARVNIEGRWWLENDTQGYGYHWVEDTTEPTASQRWCKLYYGGAGYTQVNKKEKGILWWKKVYYESAVNAFDTKYSFINNTRGTDGICVKLPYFGSNNALYSNVQIEFARPFGCCLLSNSGTTQFLWSRSSLLSNFEVNVISHEETLYRTTNTDDKNNEFDVFMDNQATNEEKSEKLKLSSNYKKNTNKSAVFKYNTNGNSYEVDMLTNLGIRQNALPEVNLAASMARNHKLPNISMKLDTHNEITPFDVYRWYHFVDGDVEKIFMVNTFSIDYEYNKANVSLISKSDVGACGIKFKQAVKTAKRNGQLLPSEANNGLSTTIGATVINNRFNPLIVNNNGTINCDVIGSHPLETTSFELNDEEMIFVVPDEYTGIGVQILDNGTANLLY